MRHDSNEPTAEDWSKAFDHAFSDPEQAAAALARLHQRIAELTDPEMFCKWDGGAIAEMTVLPPLHVVDLGAFPHNEWEVVGHNADGEEWTLCTCGEQSALAIAERINKFESFQKEVDRLRDEDKAQRRTITGLRAELVRVNERLSECRTALRNASEYAQTRTW